MEVQIAGSKQSQLPSVVDGISSAAREGGIVSPILDNNPTQSPIPRSDSIDVHPDTRPRFSSKIGTNDANIISRDTDCAKPVHQGANNVRQVIPVIQSGHAIPKTLFIFVGSPSMESTDRRDSLLMDSSSSPHPQAILPIVPPIAFPEHAIKRMIAILIDKADATWKEESRRYRDGLGSLGFAIDHHTDQEPHAQQTNSNVTTGASRPALVAFTSSRLHPDKNLSMSGLQNTFDHEHPPTATSPSGHAEVPPNVDTAATTSPDSMDGIASPGACTGVLEAPQGIALGVDTTVSNDHGLRTSDRRVISHENDELEYIDVDPKDLRKTSSQLVPGTEAKLNPQTDGDAIEDSASCASTITSRASSESTESITVEPPSIRIHVDSEIITRGLTPGAQLSRNPSVPTPPASNAISSAIIGPIYTYESDTVRASSTRTASPIPVETVAGDKEQEQSVTSMAFASPQDTMDDPMDGTSASRPLKRRLSSSVVINERENSNSYSSLASRASLPYPRPLKIKKLEDKNKGKEPQKVESEKEKGLLAHLTPRSSVSCPRSDCLDGAAELSLSPQVEDKNEGEEQECRESSTCLPHLFPETATTYPVTVAITLGSYDIHPEQRSSDSDASSHHPPNRQGDEVLIFEGSARSAQSLLHHPPTPSGGFDTTTRHNGEGQATQGPSTPTSEASLNFEADNQQAPGHASQARAKKDDYGTLILPCSPDNGHLNAERGHPHFPRRSLTPGCDYSRHLSGTDLNGSPLSYKQAGCIPSSPCERHADILPCARQGPYDATTESQQDELRHGMEKKESESEASRPLQVAIGIDCNDSSLRDGNFATVTLSASPSGQSLFDPHEQLELRNRVSPVQSFSTRLPQVEGSTQSLSLASHNPKDMPPFVHALPSKPVFNTPLDGDGSNESQILSATAMRRRICTEATSHSHLTERLNAYGYFATTSPKQSPPSANSKQYALHSQAKDVPLSMGTFIPGTSTDSSSNAEGGAWTAQLDANSRVRNNPTSTERNDINGFQDTSDPVPQQLILNQRIGVTSSGSQGSGGYEQSTNPLPRMDIALGNGLDRVGLGNSESIRATALNLADRISDAPVFEQPIAPSNQLRSHHTDSEDSSLGTNSIDTQTLPFQALPTYWRLRNINKAQEAKQFLLNLVLRTPRVEREEEKEA